MPLSGALSPYGPPGQKAADVAVDQINAAIDDVGADHTVEIIHEDNETLPTPAVNVARSMVDEGASCIAGAWASADTIPTARSVTIREGVLQISPSSTSDEITALEDDGLVNRTAPPDKYQGPTLADAIEKDLGGAEGKVVNIGARNDSYGEGLAGTFSDAWEAKGGQIGESVLYDPEQPSYDSEARQIVSGNPDTIVIIDFPETFANVGPALLRTGDYDPANAWGTDGLTIGPVKPPEIVAGMQATAPGSPRHRRGAGGLRDGVRGLRPGRRGAGDIRGAELRRRDPLLPGGGRRRFHGRPGDGRPGARHQRPAR